MDRYVTKSILMGIAAIAVLIIGVLLTYLVAHTASRISAVAPTTSIWTTSTIPRSTPTEPAYGVGFQADPSTTTSVVEVELKVQVIHSTTSTTEAPYISVSEICRLAESSPSGEGFSFGLFATQLTDDSTDQEWRNWSFIVDSMGQAIWDAYNTKACSERGNEIIEQAIPFLLETEG
jgi:hypothetical protein